MINPNMLGLFGIFHWSAPVALIALIVVLVFWKKYRDKQM